MAPVVPSHPSITTGFKVKGPHWATGEHSGIDYGSPGIDGAEVRAPWGGTITGASWGSAYGNHVVIDFDRLPDGSPGLWGVIAHMSRVVKSRGRVERGELIGYVGATGNVTGPHTHFEIQPQPGWVKGSYRDPMPWHNASGGGSSSGGGIAPKYTSRIMSDMLGFDEPPDGYPDGYSDTIKELQWRLNNTKLQGGQTLPETGSYWVETDEEVRLWQQQVCGDAPDPERKSYLGPRQRAKMFPPPYEIVDRGLPRVAGGGGGDVGGGGGGGVVDPPPPDVVPWFVPDSLKALKAEVDARWPNRSTASDGTIGDTAHSTSMSEHNPVGHQFGPQFGTPGAVHAMDITTEGADSAAIIDAITADPRTWYWIHQGIICSKTYGWERRPYTGDPHDKHIHISLRADDQADAVAAETDTSPWFKAVAPPSSGDYVTREEYEADMDRISQAFKDAGDDG